LAHEVFISYSNEDESVATAICSALESQNISCWMAPRDIPPGVTWAVAIINAIKQSRLFILVLSETSNVSPPVLSELDSAANRGIPIIPVRIDNTQLSEAMEFYTARYQWLDARTPPLDKPLKQLISTVQRLLAQADAVKARKEAEDAAKQRARQEVEAKEKASLATEQAQAVTEAERVKKEVETAREAAVKARKEAEEAAKEKARHEAEAARAQRETAELMKTLEAARAKAKKKEPVIRQEQLTIVKKSLFRTGGFWVGFIFLFAGLLWQIFNVFWPLEKQAPAEAFNQAFGMMVGVGIPVIFVGSMYVGRALHLSNSGARTWFGLGVVTIVLGLALSFLLSYRMNAGGAPSDSELLLPSVLGSAFPFMILGLYSLGGALSHQINKHESIDKASKTSPLSKPLYKSVMFWFGIGLLTTGLGWQILSPLFLKPVQATDFNRIIILALPFTFLGSYFVGRILSQRSLNKLAWFGTAVTNWVTAILLSVTVILVPLSDRLISWMYFIFPALLLAVLPLIILGIYCILKGSRESRLLRLPSGDLDNVGTTRPFLFWTGSVLFVLSQAFYWAIFLWIMPTNGIYPNLIEQIIPIILISVLGMALIWLSQRKLRDGWFWPGSEIFAFGIGAIPQWINIYLNIELFPPQTSPHDLSDIGVDLGLTIPLMAIGALCLWKGWPRTGVKNPLGEMLGFIITLSLVSFGVTIFFLAIAD